MEWKGGLWRRRAVPPFQTLTGFDLGAQETGPSSGSSLRDRVGSGGKGLQWVMCAVNEDAPSGFVACRKSSVNGRRGCSISGAGNAYSQ